MFTLHVHTARSDSVSQIQDEESGGGRDPSRIKPASLVEKPESPKRVLDRWRSFVALDPSDTMLYAELFEEDEEVERKARLSKPLHQHIW